MKTHLIKKVMISYENLQVLIGKKWYYMKPDKLAGIKIKGEFVKKRTRTWLE